MQNKILLKKDNSATKNLQALWLVHQNHWGIVKTKHMVRGSFWWSKLNNEVEDLVKTCLFYQAVTPSSQFEPLNPIYMPSHLWEYLYWDLCGPFPKGEYVFTDIGAYFRGCTPKGHFFKMFDKGIRVDIFQTWLPIDIDNQQLSKPCFSKNEKLLTFYRNPSCKIGNLLAKT